MRRNPPGESRLEAFLESLALTTSSFLRVQRRICSRSFACHIDMPLSAQRSLISEQPPSLQRSTNSGGEERNSCS
ncbi:hypothetical protein QQF64_035073 [Cirrhinus molitorella]|uniref:Uncharacterized protein n=1 Tax=Cirrhinus molitorella TaxID=172907 RepID=A0ABR3NER1_9TELE